jgi:hypothetical protein
MTRNFLKPCLLVERSRFTFSFTNLWALVYRGILPDPVPTGIDHLILFFRAPVLNSSQIKIKKDHPDLVVFGFFTRPIFLSVHFNNGH